MKTIQLDDVEMMVIYDCLLDSKETLLADFKPDDKIIERLIKMRVRLMEKFASKMCECNTTFFPKEK